MRITELELCFSDLGHLLRSDELRDLRRHGLRFIWTAVFEFEAVILNVFLPEGHVFGNFRVYEQLRYSERFPDALYEPPHGQGNLRQVDGDDRGYRRR